MKILLDTMSSQTLKVALLRSNHRKYSVKKGVLRNFVKFTGKHFYQSLFFNKVKACNFMKKENLAQVFSCEFCEISKNTFFTEHPLATASNYCNGYKGFFN